MFKTKNIVIVLIGFFIVDLFLILYYFYPSIRFFLKRIYIPSLSFKKRIYYDLYDKNSTDTYSKIFNLQLGDVIITEPDYEKLILGGVWLNGYINKNPYIDPKTNNIILEIKYSGKKNIVIAKTILVKGSYINSIFAKKGKIERIAWKVKNSEDLYPSLKKGDPIIVNLYFSDNYNITNKNCNDVCKKSIKIINTNYQYTKKLIESLKGNNKTYIEGFVGPIKEIIIFNKY